MGTASKLTSYLIAATLGVTITLSGCSNGSDSSNNSDNELRSLQAAQSDIEALMVDFLATTGAPGVLVGVQVGEETPLLLAEGIDEINTGEVLVADRIFRIGSVTKPVVASVALATIKAGDMALADTIGSYLPGVTNGEATIAQVLAHDAGLSDWDAIDGGIRTLLFADISRNWQPSEIVEAVGFLPAHSEPGNGFHYSNPGYQMLGAILEQVNGATISEQVTAILSTPYGLDDIRLGPLAEQPERLIHGWGDLGGNLIDNQLLPSVSIDSLFYTTGAGYSDLDDLLRFVRLYWGSEGALSIDGVDVAEDRSGNYGFATQFFSEEVVGHTGDINGARTAVGHQRNLDVSVVVHVNTNTIDRQPTVDLALGVIDALRVAQ
ncbi:MAG: serine hydrolase domain-containing protein [Pseudomonadota bacterium]